MRFLYKFSILMYTLFLFSLIAPQAAPQAAPLPNTTETEFEKNTKKIGDWLLECEKNTTQETCVMSQTILEPKEKKFEILRVTIGRFEQEKIGAIISAPLGVALIPGIEIKLIDSESKESNLQVLVTKDGKEFHEEITSLSYERCLGTSCISGFPLDENEINRLKKGKSLKITISTSPNLQDDILSYLSLTGFTAAIDEIMARK